MAIIFEPPLIHKHLKTHCIYRILHTLPPVDICYTVFSVLYRQRLARSEMRNWTQGRYILKYYPKYSEDRNKMTTISIINLDRLIQTNIYFFYCKSVNFPLIRMYYVIGPYSQTVSSLQKGQPPKWICTVAGYVLDQYLPFLSLA